MTDARARIEQLAEQMHIWYLEACQKLHPESFNAKAQKPYAELSEEQKFLDRYIAERALSWEAAPAHSRTEIEQSLDRELDALSPMRVISYLKEKLIEARLAVPAQGSAENVKLGDGEAEWFVSAKGLDRLASEAAEVGADRYAEAYRIVAMRLREMNTAPPSVPQASPEPSESCEHERLDEEGYCRRCGVDMRSGIDLSAGQASAPEGEKR